MKFLDFFFNRNAQEKKQREVFLESLEDRTLFDASPMMHFLASQPLNTDALAPCQDCDGGQASASAAFGGGPDLFVTKSNGVTTVFPGDSLTYTITYVNDGAVDATGVVITENLPAGTTFDPTNSSAGWVETSPGSGVFEFDHGTLVAFSDFFDIFFAVTVDGPNVDAGLDAIINTVSIADDGANGADMTPSDNQETEFDTLVAAPNLSITKTDGGISASAGDTVVYTLDYLNIGNQGATGIVLTENLPANTAFNAAGSTAGWVETSPGIFELAVSDLAAGAVGTADFAVTIDSPLPGGTTSISNTASIADDGTNGFDPPSNNTANDDTPITSVFAFDLAVDKTDGDLTTVAGGTVVYTVNYSNVGQTNATGVVVEENLPPGTTFDPTNSDPGWVETSPGSGTYQFTVGNLNVGQSGSIPFAVIVDNPVGAGFELVANLVTIFDDGSNGTDDNAANNAYIENTPIDASPDLFVTKDNGVTSVSVGDLVSYVISYGNSGDQGASGVELTETLPAGVSFDVANSTPGWVQTTPGVYVFSIGGLASGATGNVTFAVVVDDPIAAGIDQLVNNVLISDDGSSGSDADTLNDSFVETDAVNAEPDLQVTKVDGVTAVNAGDSIVYTITYSNVGTQGATNVVITETLPAGTSYDAANSTAGWVETLPGSGVFEFPVGSLAGGSLNNTVDFAVTVNNPIAAGIDQLTNNVVISDDGDNGADPTPGDNSATDINDVTAAPDLVLTKSDSGVSTTPTGTIVYTLSYSNVGTQGASGVVITETLPANTIFDAVNSTPGWAETSPGSGVYEFALGTVPGGTSSSVDFAVQVDGTPVNGDFISNTANIADDGANGADLDPLDNTATDSTPVVAAVDLVLTKDDGGVSVAPNGTVVYTLSYQNQGNLDATGVFITETIPSGATFDAANSDPAWLETVPGSGIYVFSIGSLNAGASGSVDFAVTVSSPVVAGLDALQNSATIDDDNLNGPESNDLNNTAIDSTPIDAAPDLFVTIDDGEVSVDAGGLLSYSIDYGNLGPQDATNVILTETLPAGTSFDVASSDPGWVETSAGSGVYEFALGDLAVGDTGSVAFAVIVDSPLSAAITQIVNNVVISDDGANGADENPVDNSATDTNNVGSSVGVVDLAIVNDNSVVAAQAGDQISYVIDFVNNGTADATGVVISETLPAGTTFDSANSTPGWYESVPGSGNFYFDVGPLGVAANGSVTFAVTVDDAVAAGIDQLVNSVSITSSEVDDDLSDNVSTDTDGLNVAPDLFVTKDDGRLTFVAGESVVYTIEYGNDGSQDSTNVVVSEILPAGTSFDAANSSGGWVETVPGSGNFEFIVGDLAAGSIGNVINFAVVVDDPLGSGQVTVQNAVSITDDGANGADENGFDNLFNDQNDLWTPPAGNFVDLAIEKTDFQNTTLVGDVIFYQIAYANNGNIAATNVVVTDILPSGVRFDSLSSDPGWSETSPGSGVYEFSLGTVSAGQTGVLTLSIAVENAGAGMEQVVNTATISDDGTNGVDARPDNNTAVDTNAFSAAVDLYVSKDDFQSTFIAGESIIYTISYGNRGEQDASGVVLTESLPAGASFDAANSSAGWLEVVPGSGIFTYDVGYLSGGSLGNVVNFAVTVDDPLASSISNLFNTVSIQDDGTSGVDETLADNIDSDNNVLFTPPSGNFVDLAVHKTDAVTTVSGGDRIVYAINYSNNGNVTATGVVLTETLPSGSSFDAANSDPAWSETTPGSGVYELVVGNMLPGQTRTVAFAVIVDDPLAASITQLINDVTINDDVANGADARPDDNSSSDVDGVDHGTGSSSVVDLYVTKDDFQVTFTENESLVYTIVYGNNGDADATGVVLTEILPAGTSFDSANSTAGWTETSPGSGVYQYQAGSIAGGSVGNVVLFAVRVDNPLAAGITQLENAVRISDDGNNGADLIVGDNQSADINSLYTPPVTDAVDLSVDKSDGVILVQEGQSVVYAISYANNGALNATGVVITEALPAGVAFDAANSDSGWLETTPGSGIYEFNIGALASGGSGTVAFAVTVDDPLAIGISTLVNNVSIADDGANGADSRIDDNSDSDINSVDRGTTATNVVDLYVTKDDGQITFVAGESLVYVIDYGNNGDTDATGVILTEVVPAGMSFDATNSSAGWVERGVGTGIFDFDAGTVAAGSTGNTVLFAVTVDDPLAPSVTQLANTVSITDDGINGSDFDTLDNAFTDVNDLYTPPAGNHIDFTIDKSDGVTVVAEGDRLIFAIDYANNGTIAANGVIITETLAAGTSFDSANSTLGWSETSPGSGVFEFAVGTMAAGESRTISFAVFVDDPLAASISTLINSISIADDGSNGADARPDDNDDLDVNLVNRNALSNFVDLYITKDDSQITFTDGEVLVYTVVYGNDGDIDSTGVVITETLPSGTRFNAAASTPGWLETGPGTGIYEYNAGTVSAGSRDNVVLFAVTVDDPIAAGITQLINFVSIADDGANGTDADATDNSVADTNDQYIAPSGGHVDLSISKSDGVVTVVEGETVIYTIDYWNHGTLDATGVVITETLPAGTSFDSSNSSSGWVETSVGSGVFEFTAGTVIAGESRTITFAITVDNPLAASITSLTNSVVISDDGTNGADARPDDNSYTDIDSVDRGNTNPVGVVDLYVDKDNNRVTFSAGERLVYTIRYGNDGDTDAAGVVITEVLPAGANFDAMNSSPGWVETSAGSGVFEYSVGALAAGSMDNLVLFAVTVDDPLAASISHLANSVVIRDDGSNGDDFDTSDNADNDVDTLYVAPSVDHVDLAITKSNNQVIVFEGDTLIYTIDYVNNGTLDATGVVITEALPAGTSIDFANSSSGWTETAVGSGIFEFSAGTVLAGESPTIAFAVIVDDPLAASLTELANSATISDDGANGADARPDDNVAVDVDVVEQSTGGASGVDLFIAKSDNRGSFRAGERLIYEITYGNNGDTAATGVVITEVLPAGTSFDAISSSPGWVETSAGSGVYEYTVGSLAALDTNNLILFAVRVDNPLAAGITQLVNNATIADDSANGADLDAADNASSDTNSLFSQPAGDHVELAIEVSDDRLFAGDGDRIVYTISYTNYGTIAATGVTIRDTLPAGTTFAATASTAGWTQPNAGQNIFEFDAGTLAAGETRTIQLVVDVDDPLAATINQITNNVSISDDGANGADARLDNNFAVDVDFVRSDTGGSNGTVDLYVSKDDSQVSFVAGESLIYTIIYGNNGDADAVGSSLTESLPLGTSFDASNSSSGWVETFPGSRVYVLDIGTVAADTHDHVVLFAVTVDDPLAAGISQVANSVSITDNGASGLDTDDSNNAATDTNDLFTAPLSGHVDLRIDKSDGVTIVSAGDSVIYTIDYSNNGTLDATGVVIMETLPAGVTFDATNSSAGWVETSSGSGVFEFAAGTVAAGESRTITFAITVDDPIATAGGLLINGVSIADDAGNGADARPDDNSDADTNTVNGVTNGGNTGGGNTGGGNTGGGNTGGGNTGGGNTGGGNTGGGNTGGGNTGGGNTGGGNTGGGNTGFVDYVITKDDGLSLVTTGDTVTYTITVQNIGTGNGSGVLVTDDFTTGIFATVVADNGGIVNLSNGTIEWNLGALNAGESIVVTVTAQLADSVAAGIQQYTNSVSVSDDGALGADPNLADNSASDTNTIEAAPDLAITKTADREFPFVGGVLVYSLTYTNVGTQGATGVTITESLPPGTIFSVLHSSSGWRDLGNGQFEFLAGGLAVGESRTIRFAVQIVDDITTIENEATIRDDGANGGEPNQANNSSAIASGVDPFDRETIGKRYYLASTASGIYQTLIDPPQAANGIRITRLAEFIANNAELVEREASRLAALANPPTESASRTDETIAAAGGIVVSANEQSSENRRDVGNESTNFTPNSLASRISGRLSNRFGPVEEATASELLIAPDENRIVQPLSASESHSSAESQGPASEHNKLTAPASESPEVEINEANEKEIRRWARWRDWLTKRKSA